MTEISDWFQNNWIDLARLLVQCAILAAVVRYGRKLLATMRASQEQVGALLKLSVSDTVPERAAAVSEPMNLEPAKGFESASLNIREPQAEPLREPEPEPVFAGAPSRNGYAAEREQSLGGRVIGAPASSYTTLGQRPENPAGQRVESPSLTAWVSAPDIDPVRGSAPALSVPARPSASNWLQAPMRSSGASPWRKVVRWLQAPAGH